jgi:putative metal-binding protein
MKLSSASRIVLAVLAFHVGAYAAADDDLIFADGFDECAGSATRACYQGPPGTDGVGVCQAGLQHCVSGTWGPCTAERTPAFESCNGLDDDCNGFADNALGSVTCGIGACEQTVAACQGGQAATCVPAAPGLEGPTCDGVDNDCDGAVDEDCGNCLRVSPTGNDVSGDGTIFPFRTIGAAITRAAATSVPRVCVAAGNICSATSTYAESVTMADGVTRHARSWTASGSTGRRPFRPRRPSRWREARGP